MKYRYMPTTNTRQMGPARSLSAIKWIVIHATSNSAKGANALNHYRYLNRATRYGSAHYYVDDHEIIQTIGDSRIAWAVGDNQGYGVALNGCTNANSLSIEMCMASDGNQEKVYKNTVELTKNLMKKFNIGLANVCRHYDVSRKSCPIIFKPNNWAQWHKFKADLTLPIEWIIDLEKDSEFGENSEGKEYKEVIKNSTEPRAQYVEYGRIKCIITDADNIYIQQLGGKTLRDIGAVGINGTFFDTPRPEAPKSTWSIAINNGQPIGPNADRNHWRAKVKRGTLIYADGKLSVQTVNSMKQIKGNKIQWAIGGVGLYPSYAPDEESVPKDIIRTCPHTWIGYKGDKVYLCASARIDISTILKFCKINLDGAVLLDGGGSTQMFWYTGSKIHSARRLNNIVGVKKK